jgi:hypothetical protein
MAYNYKPPTIIFEAHPWFNNILWLVWFDLKRTEMPNKSMKIDVINVKLTFLWKNFIKITTWNLNVSHLDCLFMVNHKVCWVNLLYDSLGLFKCLEFDIHFLYDLFSFYRPDHLCTLARRPLELIRFYCPDLLWFVLRKSFDNVFLVFLLRKLFFLQSLAVKVFKRYSCLRVTQFKHFRYPNSCYDGAFQGTIKSGNEILFDVWS